MLYKRIILDKILPYIHTDDVVVIHGARQTGKTSLLKLLINELIADKQNYFYMDLEDWRFLEICEDGVESTIEYLNLKGMIKNNKRLFLIIDEIQYMSNPSSFIKLTHDHHPEIKLIVSGSSSFEIKSKFKDSLVGRTVNFELFPLNFQEFIYFKEKTYDLGRDINSAVINKELIKLYTEYVLYGGYPKIVLANSLEKKEKYLQQIISTYVNKDIRDLAKIKDISKFNRLITMLSSQSGQLLNINEICNTVNLARKTVEDYLYMLENTYIIKLLRPYSGNLRSELFKTPKIFFYDTGLMHLLHLKTIPTTLFGQSFETSVFSEFIKAVENDKLFYWRTQDKKEIDFIYMDSNKIVPFEVKINASSLKTTAIKYFLNKYKPKYSYCVSLEGKINQRFNYITQIFPWEIEKKLN